MSTVSQLASVQPTLSDQQSRLLDWLTGARPNVFITGRAGTGKTTLMREFLRRAGNRAAVIAPTGVAAMQAEVVQDEETCRDALRKRSRALQRI